MTGWSNIGWQARFGLLLLAALGLMALAAPLIAPGDPLALSGPPLLRPFLDAAHPLGTDRLGRDVLAGIVHGSRTTLMVALFSAAAALMFGSLIGTLSGFLGGIVDLALMRLTEAFQTVPAFLLALAAISMSGPGIPTLVFAISLGNWTQAARVTRAEVLSLRERDFVAAARVLGMRPLEIAFREILPNAFGPLVSLAAISVASAILIEAALSFLGFGDPNRVTWGSMIAEGRTVLRAAPYLSVVPGIALVATVLGVHFAGRGLALRERVSRRERVAQ
ncbi:ABC transporter permease [Phyllobacterium sp. 0TCS1.6C]|uniref:ABC transporter permease n=1 Tax=unclassified Phyllobacterium TaxID=2638441 RepID=UPI002264E1D4|nr:MULTISPECIES: ABC transporter permease [unclassified Phyllobacterium]MCX8281332.1 ABC transporter permease [Phyllobacterium sp. 0TCS1.6C]MCX8296012.1 ABC transporter permease [Phyllobacterium sp. 0TCS1.6A]